MNFEEDFTPITYYDYFCTIPLLMSMSIPFIPLGKALEDYGKRTEDDCQLTERSASRELSV